MLSVENLRCVFGRTCVLDGVSLRFEANRISGLVGPNGAGKSTLFDVITGRCRATAGRVLLDGVRIDGLRADQVARLGIGRTFQAPRPLRSLTVLENLLVAAPGQRGESPWRVLLQRRAIAQQEAALRAAALEQLERVGLAAEADTPAATLSGGQQKLLELARALMFRPSMVLLDEPAAGVHPDFLDTLIQRILQLHEQGQGFIIIEHDMAVIERLCPWVGVLVRGRVLAQGPVHEVLGQQAVVDAYLAAGG